MNTLELVDVVAAKTEVTRGDAAKAVKAVLGAITEALKAGEEVRLPGFGNFEVSQRSARTGRNPKTGEPIAIAASKSVKFSSGKMLRDCVNG